ncbi:hypothetical protein PM082_017785 [Marasmius tenuissimus]|nr:hypothetical protein PM082_017785 [Marasmius tenuissimus]
MTRQPKYVERKQGTPRLPNGVVEGAGKPEGYKSYLSESASLRGNLDPQKTYFGSAEEESRTTIFTIQPSALIDATRATLPDWYTVCIVSPAVKRMILSTPGYPQPLNRPSKTRYRITDSRTAGIGIFATADMELGDLVYSERALLMLSRAIEEPANLPAHYTWDQKIQAALYDQEKLLEIALKQMPKEVQDEYMALHNCHLHDGSGPLVGILRTNSLQIHDYSSANDSDPHAAVFRDASRINHSCSPNVSVSFNRQTFGMELRALRSIKDGEELFIAYNSVSGSTAERQDELVPYGFQCECRTCREPEKSDLLRSKIGANHPRVLFGRRLVMWLMSPGLPESYVVDPCLELIRAMEEGGLEMSYWYGCTLEYLFKLYCATGNASEAFKCLRKHELLQHVVAGDKPRSDAELRKAVSSYDRWNWKARVQRTMNYLGSRPSEKEGLESPTSTAHV